MLLFWLVLRPAEMMRVEMKTLFVCGGDFRVQRVVATSAVFGVRFTHNSPPAITSRIAIS
jgi:hypothetical protein